MQRWKKCVENEEDFGKKNVNSVKDVPMVYIIFIVTIIIVKKKKGIAFVPTFVNNKI